MKKINVLAAFAIWFGSVSLTLFFAAAPAQASQTVRFTQTDYFVIVPVFINDAGPFDFIFDTGASATVMDQELVTQLAITPFESATIVTVSGSQSVSRYRLNRLTLGSQAAANVTAISAELGEIHRFSSRIRGILGQNFLSAFNYILDYRKRSIEFEENDEFKDKMIGNRLAVERDRGRMLIAVESPLSTKSPLRLVLDSGADHLVLFSAALPYVEFVAAQGAGGFTRGRTVISNRLMQNGHINKLTIGSEKFNDLPVSVVPGRVSKDGPVEQGLMPTNFFRCLYFNNKENVVIVNPRYAMPRPTVRTLLASK